MTNYSRVPIISLCGKSAKIESLKHMNGSVILDYLASQSTGTTLYASWETCPKNLLKEAILRGFQLQDLRYNEMEGWDAYSFREGKGDGWGAGVTEHSYWISDLGKGVGRGEGRGFGENNCFVFNGIQLTTEGYGSGSSHMLNYPLSQIYYLS